MGHQHKEWQKKYLELGRVFEIWIGRAGICPRQENLLHRVWDVKSAAARNPESNGNGGFKLKEPGLTTTTHPKRLYEAN